MDISTIDDVIHWINRQPDFEYVDTTEVVTRAATADLPEEAVSALRDLPQQRWSRPDLVAEVREVLLPHVPLR